MFTRFDFGRNHRVPYTGPTGSLGLITNLPRPDLSFEENLSLIYSHARMPEAAWLATEVPSIQDSQGRNGLQCLAEVLLNLDILSLGRTDERSQKRKRGQSDPKTSSRRLTFRYELIQAMASVGVDLNNYDIHGNTVLMAFVVHLPDGDDDKTLMEIFKLLIKSGAIIHRRTREGESALHVAVRLGRKVATREILIQGANVHSRTAEGKGVLALGKSHYLKARITSHFMHLSWPAWPFAKVLEPSLLRRGYKNGQRRPRLIIYEDSRRDMNDAMSP